MFTVTVRDHVMIAHSLSGEGFGPAQRLHGATYVVDAAFSGERLDPAGVLVDIGLAGTQVRAALADLDYRNLDEHPDLAGRNSTTEAVAKLVADRIAERIAAGDLGETARGLASISVTLHESHVASAGYERAP